MIYIEHSERPNRETAMITMLPNSCSIAQVPATGRSAILCAPEHTGTLARIKRENEEYFSIAVREIQGAFSGKNQPVRMAVTSKVWFDTADNRWVVDFREDDSVWSVEVTRVRNLRAALNAAVWSASHRGHLKGRW